MAERAHPEDPGFKRRFLGLIPNRFRRNLFKRYKFCLQYIQGKVVLDIPCGVGWGTSLLKGAKELYGVDISKEAIQYAISHYEGINFIISNMAFIPFADNTFDVIICLEGIEHIDAKTGILFLTEVKRICRNEGILILTCPLLDEKGQSSRNPYHIKEYDYQELNEILNQQLQIELLEKIKGPEGYEIKTICRIIKP